MVFTCFCGWFPCQKQNSENTRRGFINDNPYFVHFQRQLENNKVKVSSVLQQKEAAILKVSEVGRHLCGNVFFALARYKSVELKDSVTLYCSFW